MASDETPDPETIVSALYHAILRRAPDPLGLDLHVQRIRAGASLREVARDFIECPEAEIHRVVQLGSLDAYRANEIELDISAEQRQSLWDRVADVWSRLGREDPYWSVLSFDRFRTDAMADPRQVDDFFDSGLAEIARAEYYVRRHGRELSGRVCVDYGCGLGRTTLWLARRFDKVVAVDVSAAHLAMAETIARDRGVSNIEFRQLRGRRDLLALVGLSGMDFFHSVLVLQHSPPPLIADILSAAFSGLARGGCAFFQVPTYMTNYKWQYGEYMSQATADDELEIHVLPQSAIFGLAAAAGAVPLEVQPDHCTGIPHGISNTFVFAKP